LRMRALGWLVALSLTGCHACRRAPPSPSISDGGLDASATRRLYAQRVADIHLREPSGPIIGRVHPGAELDVGPAGTRYVPVSPPSGFRRYGQKDDDLVGFVEQDAFNAIPQAARAPSFPPNRRLVKDVPALDLDATPGDQTRFAATICGELHVLSVDGAAH